jgi:predicted small secreted protein
MKKTVFLGLLVVLLAFGSIGCDTGNGNGNGDSGKKLTINGIDLTGNVTVIINPEATPNSGTVAYGTISGATSGSNVTFDLKVVNLNNMANPFTNTNWNGNGSYYILVYNWTPQQVMAENTAPVKSIGPTSFSNETTVVTW